MQITMIGLDITRRVFQAHGADVTGKAVLRRKLQRAEVLSFFSAMPRCLMGIQVCSTAQHWPERSRRSAIECASCRPDTLSPGSNS